MATAPALPLVTAEEYLSSSYDPEMEFIDGVLEERAAPTFAHGVLQGLVIEHLARYKRQFRFAAVPEVRFEVSTGSRYRIPDVLVCPLPLPPGGIATVAYAVIEILSPDDRMSELLNRFQDYKGRGVSELLLLDPEHMTALRYEHGSFIQAQVQELRIGKGQRVPFAVQTIFAEMREQFEA